MALGHLALKHVGRNSKLVLRLTPRFIASTHPKVKHVVKMEAEVSRISRSLSSIPLSDFLLQKLVISAIIVRMMLRAIRNAVRM